MRTLTAESAAKIQFGIARKCDFDRLSIDDIKAIKSDDSITHHRYIERASKPDETDEENMTVIDIASTEHVDSMGDIIKVAGWDLIRLKVGKIPLIGSHNPDPIPYGLVISGNKRAKCDDGVKCLELKSRFHEQEIYGDSEYGKHVAGIRTLVMRGDFPGRSVGFIPKDYHWPDDKEREANGQPGVGMVFDVQELLENTVTCIPANNRAQQRKSMQQTKAALRDLVQSGKLDKDTAELIARDYAVGEEAFLARVQMHSKTVVPISKDLPWLATKSDAASTETLDDADDDVEVVAKPDETSSESTAQKELLEAAKAAIASVQKSGQDALATFAREAVATMRRELSAVSREILEPAESGMEELAERLEAAVMRIAPSGTEDSDRAEVSPVRAPNGAATTAVSTGTSRDNPTQPTPELSIASELFRALEATNGGPDTTHADSRPDQARSLQDA